MDVLNGQKSRGFLKGRMNRALYWFSFGILVVLHFLFNLPPLGPTSINEVLLVILWVPRLHDIGRTGWWVGVPFGLEIAVIISATNLMTPEAAEPVLASVTLFMLGVVVLLGAIPGQPTTNYFGEPPPPGLGFGKRMKPD